MIYKSLLTTSQRLCRSTVLVLLVSLTALVGCEDDSIPAAKRKVIIEQIRLGKFDMGRGVYQILSRHSGKCAGFVYSRNRGLVINAVNALMGPVSRRQIPQAIEQLYPLIDDGTLPGMINDTRSILGILHRETPVLQAIVDASKGPSPVSASLSMQMIGQLLSYPEIDRLFDAFAKMLQVDDGRMIDGLLSFASSALHEMGREMQNQVETEEAKKSRRSLARELLRELDGVSAGPSVVIPRLDADGVPLTETVTEKDPYKDYGQQPGGADGESQVDWDLDGTKDELQPNTEYTGETGGLLGGFLDNIEWPATLVLAVNKFTAKGLTTIGRLLHNGKQTYAEDIMGRPIVLIDPTERSQTVRPTIQMNKTVLAVLMRSAGEAVKAGLHCELSTFLKFALGDRVGNGYSATNPLAEMTHAQLELFKYKHAPKLLDALSMTLTTDPELGEALLAKVLRLVTLMKDKKKDKKDKEDKKNKKNHQHKMHEHKTHSDNGKHLGWFKNGKGPHNGFGKKKHVHKHKHKKKDGHGHDDQGNDDESDGDDDVDDAQSEILQKQNMILMDKMFKVKAATGRSAGRALIDVLTQMGDLGKTLPKTFIPMFFYRKMVRGDDGDGDLIDQARSIPVDRTKDAWYKDESGQLIDNRSCFHRLVNLVKTTNACKIPVLNKSLAFIHHELLAELTPATAIFVNDLMVKIGLGSGGDLICKGLQKHVISLKELTTSGAMDALIPVMKAFKNQGELQLFIDLLILSSPTYEDDVRPGEENMIEILDSGALEVVIDLVSLANTIRIPGTKDEVVADVLVDFIADMLDHDKPVTNIFGEKRPAKIFLLLDATKSMDRALKGTPGEEAYKNLIDQGIDIFLDVEHHDGDTPDDTSDDFDSVGNKFIVPLLARFLNVAADDLERDPTKRVQDLEQDQRNVGDKYQEASFVDMVEFLELYCENENKQIFDDALIYFLTPQDNAEQNLFGSLLAISGLMLQTQADNKSLGTIMVFAGRIINPQSGYAPRLIKGVLDILEADEGKILVGFLRRGFSSKSSLNGESPIGVLMLLAGQIKDRCTGGDAPLTVAILRAQIEEILRSMSQADAMVYMVLNRLGGPGGGKRPDFNKMYAKKSYMGQAYIWQKKGGQGGGGKAKLGAFKSNKKTLRERR